MKKTEEKSREPDSCIVENGWVKIYVPGKKDHIPVGKIEDGKYVWDGASEPDHTINVEGKRCWGIDKGLLDRHLLPGQIPIEIRSMTGDVYFISAQDAYEHGTVKQYKGYGWQYYIPMECFLFNGKPFNES